MTDVTAWHPMLARQLRRALGGADPADWGAAGAAVPDAAGLAKLLTMVDESYRQFDRDLALRSRSLALSSQELTQANDRLRAEAQGQQRVLETLREGARELLKDLPTPPSGSFDDVLELATLLRELMQQRLQAEQALDASQRQFRELMASLRGCAYRVTPDPRRPPVSLTEGIEIATGHPAQDYLSGRRHLVDLVHPDDQPRVERAIRAAVAARRSYDVQFRYRHADGSVRWAAEKGHGVFADDGSLLYLDGLLFERTQDELAQREVTRARKQLLDAVDALDVGLVLYDEQDRVAVCNRKFRTLYAPIVDQLAPGTPHRDLMRALYRSGMVPAESALDEAGWLAEVEAQWRSLDAGPRVRDFEMGGRWYRCDDSRTPGGVTICLRSDITATKQLNLELMHARDEAEAASRAKSRFLANMSHELRSPLNAVIGAAQLLRGHAVDPARQAHLVDAIQRSGTNLLGLIENILDLSRIEAGALALHEVDFHLVECVEAALSTAALAAHAKGLRLACVIDPQLAAWRHGDASRLRQVVLNLLGNAVKFTERGEVVLRVRPGAGAHRVLIQVSDTGVGIGATSLAHIFQPFRQADDGAARRFSGSGLGLAIVHQLAQTMGGQLQVSSTLGVGSCFEFEVPLRPARQAPAEPAPLNPCVAYFEPHDASAQALQAQLERLGCQTLRCQGAAQLRAWLGVLPPGTTPWLLVAVDAPQAGGFVDEVVDLVEPQHVIAMSSQASYEVDSARDGMQLSRQIIKPVTRAALVSRLVGAADLQPAVETPVVAQALLTHEQLARLTHVLVVEDDELNRFIVRGMLHHAGCRVSVARNGHEALAAMRELDRVDLVLMDWQMPDMDGLEASRRLRDGQGGEAGRTVPIVALTANAFAEDRAACLAAGMNDFLTKPVLASSLLGAVQRWGSARAASVAATSPVPATGVVAASPASASGPPVYDPSVLAAMPMVADGSAPGYEQELLGLFEERVESDIGSMRQAQQNGDLATLLRLVHTLKSSSASVGALELADLSAAQELSLRRHQPVDPGFTGRLEQALRRLRQAVREHQRTQRAQGVCP